MSLTKRKKQNDELCCFLTGGRRCVLYGGIIQSGRHYCEWHYLWGYGEFGQNYNQFIEWREIERKQYGLWGIGTAMIENVQTYLDDETVWMAIKGELTREEYMKRYLEYEDELKGKKIKANKIEQTELDKFVNEFGDECPF